MTEDPPKYRECYRNIRYRGYDPLSSILLAFLLRGIVYEMGEDHASKSQERKR